jgi:aspartyl-tRNA(Asn)/glutamyl-tRNA(Gln) amidotransferase subunit A
MTGSDPTLWTLAEAARAVRDKRISSEELSKAAIARIDRVAPKIDAVAAIDTADALAQARAADALLAKGAARGALHGVPLAHKDMYYRAGRVSGCGSKIRADFVPDVTSTALARLDAAGALDIARLNMVEFALGVTGHNEVMPTPKNPWNTAHITGGSSSGSGAAVAARLVYGAMGSDTGGSIRFPACCNGVTGLKPTCGRVSRYGAMPLSPSFDTLGPLTRTVEDAALILQEIAGADTNDPTTSALPVPDYAAALGRGVKGMKIGVPENYFYDPVDAEVANLVRASLDVLTDAGAELVAVRIPDVIADTNFLTSMAIATEGAAIHQTWLAERPGDYGNQTRARMSTGLSTPATRYLQALRLRAPILAEFAQAVFDKCDVLHCPVMLTPIPTIAETDLSANPGFADLVVGMGHCTRPINFLGLAALTVPCGFTANGLPTAFQLVPRPFDEATMIAAGHAYQKATDWHRRVPTL